MVSSRVGRSAVAAATRAGLILLTFVLIVVLSQVALVSARTRVSRTPLFEIVRQSWEGTLDYFTSLLGGSLGEASSTSILGGQPRAMGALLLDQYPKSMALVLIALTGAALVGVLVGASAAGSRAARPRGALIALTFAAISTPSFLLALLLIYLSVETSSRFGIRLWPSFGFGWDNHLILPAIVLGARPFAVIANLAFVATDEVMGLDYIRTARSKGLSERIVLVRHALGNAAAPILGAVASGITIGLSTLPVVEVLFSWPGLGFGLLQAIRRSDAATTGTLLGALAVTVALARFALDAIASRFTNAATGPRSSRTSPSSRRTRS